MPEKYDPNALWVAISEYGEENLFNVYPKLLSEILRQDDAARVEGDTSEAERLVLPSDKEYRLQQYFKLVSMQKITMDLEEEQEKPRRVENPSEEQEEWAPWTLLVPSNNKSTRPPVAVRTSPGPAWNIQLVLKAARLLFKPPLPVEYGDEQEMRQVFSIIYDVFRYKTILDQALIDATFFTDYPQFLDYPQITWLFIMELARRRWEARPRGESDVVNHMLEQAGPPFSDIERAVWEQRVHFAAAIARIRIKKKAFTLSELLPTHLREEKILACVHKETITGWVNTFKAKKIASLVKRLHELGYSYSSSRLLCAGEYRFDRVCPRFITLRPLPDASIGQLDLVKDGVIVLQEREFCEGASTLCRALRVNELRGVVAQTHASSPRCSAYLAAQLKELAGVLRAKAPAAPAIPELGKLVVFGAGEKVDSYVESLKHLGIDASVAPLPESDTTTDTLVCVYSEPVYCDTPAVANALEGVVAVLATPPNSYSAVTDPIDLVCGRGGDLAMLEVLTESEIDTNGKARVQGILEEQKKTLKALLSKPQIQLILYETHSALEAENQAQVTRAVAEANRLARERHLFLKKKPNMHSSAKPKENVELPTVPSIDNTISRSDISKSDDDEDVEAPKTDSEESPKKVRPLSGKEGEFLLRKNPDDSAKGLRPTSSKARPIPDGVAPDIEPVPRDPDQDNSEVIVPNCDLFEIGTLPILGNGLDINYILDRDGCYLGLIQRKEITRLDAKYMIKVAEERGLFGAGTGAAPSNRRKKEPAAATPRRRRRKTSFEVERVAAPTIASLVRSSCRRGSAPADLPPGVNAAGEEAHVCERHLRRLAAASAISAAACTCDAKHRITDDRVAGAVVVLSPGVNAPGEEVHVCERHLRRQAAASAISAAACTCDARHRMKGRRRASLNEGTVESPRSPRTNCRRPFPVVVHDLQLRTATVHHKIFAS